MLLQMLFDSRLETRSGPAYVLQGVWTALCTRLLTCHQHTKGMDQNADASTGAQAEQ